MLGSVLWRLNKFLAGLGLSYRVRANPLSLEREHLYQPPSQPAKHLSEEHFKPTRLEGTDEGQVNGELYSIWKDIPGGHKWHHYFDIYESTIRDLGDAPLRMLEIGVNRGGSAKMWNRFLPKGSVYLGLDINPDCKQFEDRDNNIFVEIGDQSEPGFVSRITKEHGPFDIIIDDGSHVCSHMVESFNFLFDTALKSPGVYIAEDAHSNFWPGFRDQSYSFIDLSKDLVDVLHSHYVANDSEMYFRQGHSAHLSSALVPKIATQIKEIRFLDSVVIIYKNTKTKLPVSEYN